MSFRARQHLKEVPRSSSIRMKMICLSKLNFSFHRSASKRVRTDSTLTTSHKYQRMSDIFTLAVNKKNFAKRFYLPEIRGYINDAIIDLPEQINRS